MYRAEGEGPEDAKSTLALEVVPGPALRPLDVSTRDPCSEMLIVSPSVVSFSTRGCFPSPVTTCYSRSCIRSGS